jgi:hypothetical protein
MIESDRAIGSSHCRFDRWMQGGCHALRPATSGSVATDRIQYQPASQGRKSRRRHLKGYHEPVILTLTLAIAAAITRDRSVDAAPRRRKKSPGRCRGF